MQFFGGDLEDVESEGDNSIRFNYNSFGKATVTLLDLLTGNVWSELMFDTVAATGQQSGIFFYVAWLVLSRWLAVAMVVTVLFNRIDVDTEDYLKIAAKHSMRSLFALEHAFMQVRVRSSGRFVFFLLSLSFGYCLISFIDTCLYLSPESFLPLDGKKNASTVAQCKVLLETSETKRNFGPTTRKAENVPASPERQN